MKFSENLQRLRKEKGLNQEELAEKLDVTRQSVSKWESGASYPEMDKLITLCKIFDCDLDSLVSGDGKKKDIEEREAFASSFFNKFDGLMKKIVLFFDNMSLQDIFKFLIEIGMILIFLWILKIPFLLIKHLINSYTHPYAFLQFFQKIALFLVEFIYVVLSITFFLYAIKIKYLDKIDEQMLVKEVKQKEKEGNSQPEKKEESTVKYQKIYIQKTSKSISDILFSSFMLILKFFAGIFLLSFIIATFVVVIFLGFSISFTIEGLPFLGISFAFIGAILFLLCFIDPLLQFLFNQKSSVKKVFGTLISSIVLLTIGMTIFAYDFSQITYIDSPSPQIKETEKTTILSFKENINTCSLPYEKVSFQENQSLTDTLRITYTYYEPFHVQVNETLNGSLYLDYNYQNFSLSKVFQIVRKDLKERKLYNYDLSFFVSVNIEGSPEALLKIQENNQKCYS